MVNVASGDTMTKLIGVVLLIYAVASTIPDASLELLEINESVKGYKLYRLIPLFFVFAVIFAMTKFSKAGKQ